MSTVPPQAPGGPPEDGTAKAGFAKDAAAIAGGSAIVMAGGIGERGIRFVLNWVLTRFLGAEAFGAYSFVQTVVATVIGLAALGTDGGIVFFGARYRKAGERDRLKGTLWSCLAIGTVTALVTSLGMWALGRTWQVAPDKQLAIASLGIGALSAFLGTVLAVVVGGLVAAKDMRGQAIVSQLGLPFFTLVTAGVALAMGTGLAGALWALALSYALALVLGLAWFWRRFGALLADRTVPVRTELGPLLRYSVPQSLARSLYAANLRIDILMLTALATLSEVGVYKVATLIAQLGALPIMASTTMFGPVVSELVYSRELGRLQALLRAVTRWIVIVSAPVYMALVLVPDVVLSVFGAEFGAGGRALAILMLGQAVYVACGPSGALVTMGGHSMANLVNGVVSVGLNIALNAVLIPRWGLEGAAVASALSIALWSVLRVLEARWFLHASAFDRRVLTVLGAAVVLGAGAGWLGQDAALLPRLGLAAGSIATFLLVVFFAGRTDEDELVFSRVRQKLRRGR